MQPQYHHIRARWRREDADPFKMLPFFRRICISPFVLDPRLQKWDSNNTTALGLEFDHFTRRLPGLDSRDPPWKFGTGPDFGID